MARACDHAQDRAKRKPTEAPAMAAPIANHRYLAALARDRARLERPALPCTATATLKLWHEEKRVKFEVGTGADKRTAHAKIQFALVRVRYGAKRRAWFILRSSSHGATVHDSRGDCRRSFQFVRADMSRMGLDASAICAHLETVLVQRAPRAPRAAEPLLSDETITGVFHREPRKRAPRLKIKREAVTPRDFRNMNGGALVSHNRAQSRKAQADFHAVRIAPLLPARLAKGKPLTQSEFEARRISQGSPRVKRSE